MSLARTSLIRSASVALLALSAMMNAGCVVDGPKKPEPMKPQPVQRESTHPLKLTVSPLSRVSMEGVNGPAIQLHLDFRDSSGKSTKAFGLLHVELYPPGQAAGADAQTPDPARPLKQSWNTDLSNPLQNALTFDEMITRTYTITLTGIPDWLIQWARQRGPAAEGAGAAGPTVVVQFLQPGELSDKALRATYTLTR